MLGNVLRKGMGLFISVVIPNNMALASTVCSTVMISSMMAGKLIRYFVY